MAGTQTTTVEIGQLTILQLFILAYVGSHRKRPKPVYLHELRKVCIPRPIEEQADALGHAGLMRQALNPQKKSIPLTLFVTQTGWNTLIMQRARVLAAAKREVVQIRGKAESARKPEDQRRKADPNGAEDFDAQADALEAFIATTEKFTHEAIEDGPIATSERQRMIEGDGYNVSDDDAAEEMIDPSVTQTTDDDEENSDPLNPDNIGSVSVEKTGGNEGVTSITEDAAVPENDDPPTPRPRKRRR